MRQFSAFACIDWSGAMGERTPGIAIATTQGHHDVSLDQPVSGWSRAAVLDWLSQLAQDRADILIGLDLSPALPFLDMGAYFPGWDRSPTNARDLWALVDDICRDDPHLAATSFVAHPVARRHFRHRGVAGDAFGGSLGRLRACELGQAAIGMRPTSCFNLVGAAQVGKSSLTGMRVLHRLNEAIPVWPFDPLPSEGPCIVEIYTSIAARAAGVRNGRSKIRDPIGLISALRVLDAHANVPQPLTDHASDALVTAAWLRRIAADRVLWQPPGMTELVAKTEGWTFGVV